MQANMLLHLVVIVLALLATLATATAVATATGSSTATVSTLPASPINHNSTLASRHGRGGSTEAGEHWFTYRSGCIHNEATGRCLDVEQSRKNGHSADAQMWTCNGNPMAQFFTIDAFGHGTSLPREFKYWVIKARAPGGRNYCLDVPGGNAFHGQIVRWWECNGSEAQRWYLEWNGKISLNQNRELCLDPAGGAVGNRDGQPVRLWQCVDVNSNPIHKFWTSDWNSPECQP